MERLTRPCENTENGKYLSYVVGIYTGIYPNCTLGEVVERLAQYEDLGFTPVEIAYMAKFYKDKTSVEEIEENMKTAKKLIEWAKWKDLEAQGRLIIYDEETVLAMAKANAKNEEDKLELIKIIERQNKDIKTLLGKWFSALEDEGVDPWKNEECITIANKNLYTEVDYKKYLDTIA